MQYAPIISEGDMEIKPQKVHQSEADGEKVNVTEN